MTNKQSLVYLPVSVQEEYPETSVQTIFFRDKLDTRVGARGFEQPFTHWLKPINDVYVFSLEELKKLLGDAFDAGERFDHFEKFLELKTNEHGIPNKEAYLNNLTIE